MPNILEIIGCLALGLLFRELPNEQHRDDEGNSVKLCRPYSATIKINDVGAQAKSCKIY